jgi:hypothetical protein
MGIKERIARKAERLHVTIGYSPVTHMIKKCD